MRRGDIWWADLGPPVGSSPGFRRPLLVVQCDPANRSSLATVVCVALTGNLSLARLPGNVAVDPDDSGLPAASVVNVSQVVTVDRDLLDARTGRLPPPIMRRVDVGLKRMLDLW